METASLLTGTNDEQPDIISDSFQKKATFHRESSLTDDIEELYRKWKGHPNEVLVAYMRDSLILFTHNNNQLNRYVGGKSGKPEDAESLLKIIK